MTQAQAVTSSPRSIVDAFTGFLTFGTQDGLSLYGLGDVRLLLSQAGDIRCTKAMLPAASETT